MTSSVTPLSDRPVQRVNAAAIGEGWVVWDPTRQRWVKPVEDDFVDSYQGVPYTEHSCECSAPELKTHGKDCAHFDMVGVICERCDLILTCAYHEPDASWEIG